MEFYETINKHRTTREFLDKKVDIGYADPNKTVLEQYTPDLDKQIRFGRWKWK